MTAETASCSICSEGRPVSWLNWFPLFFLKPSREPFRVSRCWPIAANAAVTGLIADRFCQHLLRTVPHFCGPGWVFKAWRQFLILPVTGPNSAAFEMFNAVKRSLIVATRAGKRAIALIWLSGKQRGKWAPGTGLESTVCAVKSLEWRCLHPFRAAAR